MAATEKDRPHYLNKSELAHFQNLSTPLWVFDLQPHRMWWGNKAAIAFWKADSLEELIARDYSTDSASVRMRLKQIAQNPALDGPVRETWTLYPNETPITVVLDFQPIFIEEGRDALILEATSVLDLRKNPQSLRILEAAQSSTLMVSSFTMTGELLSQNPAAHNCYAGAPRSSSANDLEQRFLNPNVSREILEAINCDGRFEAELEVNTVLGSRTHQIIASKGRDPITAQFITILNEEDRTEQAKLQAELKRLNNELESRVARRTSELENANISLRKEISERQEVEEKLRSSQRLEAVGKLTGGVAHDFNNILAVIKGNLDLLQIGGDKLDQAQSAIQRSVNRGSELTQRLLAFSRKQSLSPKAIDVSSFIDGMTALLSRTIGESIEISTKTSADQWPVLADLGQLENAVLNIALNARDAMPVGGQLTIESSNLSVSAEQADLDDLDVGNYVVLSISDTGEGMSTDVYSHAFEPFFTTKEVGQGSGLGLSMVYGFAKQSGGLARLSSTKGSGTKIELLLPRATENPAKAQHNAKIEAPLGNGESILVVEDNPDLLDIAKIMLEGLGYRVQTASDAKTAKLAIASAIEFDLILSDMVLPGGMSGPEFVAQVRETDPLVKVIFMSGYPRESLSDEGLQDTHDILLKKPFSLAQLAQTIEQVLKQIQKTP